MRTRTFNNTYTPSEVDEVLQQILSQVQPLPNGCVEWTGRMSKGRPILTIRTENRRSTVIPPLFIAMYKEPTKPFPMGGKTFNTCCNPKCCNPDHLQFSAPYNTSQVIKIAMLLREYMKLCDKGHKTGYIMDIMGVSTPTMYKYLKEYRENEPFWMDVINKLEESGV